MGAIAPRHFHRPPADGPPKILMNLADRGCRQLLLAAVSVPFRVTFAGLQRSHRSSASPPPVNGSRQRSDRRYLPSLYALPPLLTSRCPSRRGSRPATLNNATVNPVQDPARRLSVEWTQLQTTGSPQRRARSVDR